MTYVTKTFNVVFDIFEIFAWGPYSQKSKFWREKMKFRLTPLAPCENIRRSVKFLKLHIKKGDINPPEILLVFLWKISKVVLGFRNFEYDL